MLPMLWTRSSETAEVRLNMISQKLEMRQWRIVINMHKSLVSELVILTGRDYFPN